MRVYNPDGTPYHKADDIAEVAAENEAELAEMQYYEFLFGIASLLIVALITFGIWRFYQKYLSRDPEAIVLLTKERTYETEQRDKEPE